MQAESLEVLEKADVAPAQARAIVRAIEIEIAGTNHTLATKHDLDSRITELGAALRAEMAQQGAELRAELHRSIGGVTRQMYLAILGQTAVLLGSAYFFATHVR
jgi:hypothetical protein